VAKTWVRRLPRAGLGKLLGLRLRSCSGGSQRAGGAPTMGPAGRTPRCSRECAGAPGPEAPPARQLSASRGNRGCVSWRCRAGRDTGQADRQRRRRERAHGQQGRTRQSGRRCSRSRRPHVGRSAGRVENSWLATEAVAASGGWGVCPGLGSRRLQREGGHVGTAGMVSPSGTLAGRQDAVGVDLPIEAAEERRRRGRRVGSALGVQGVRSDAGAE